MTTTEDPEFRASTINRIDRISAALTANGHDGSTTTIARILGVDHATVWRWAHGKATPRGRKALCLALLGRICRLASRDGAILARRTFYRDTLRYLVNAPPEFNLSRGYEDVLTALGFSALVPNACEWKA